MPFSVFCLVSACFYALSCMCFTIFCICSCLCSTFGEILFSNSSSADSEPSETNVSDSLSQPDKTLSQESTISASLSPSFSYASSQSRSGRARGSVGGEPGGALRSGWISVDAVSAGERTDLEPLGTTLVCDVPVDVDSARGLISGFPMRSLPFRREKKNRVAGKQ
jgi:hypothetical protein